MTLNPSSVQSLRRVFHDSLSAHDIAESLVSFDASCPAAEVGRFMRQRRYQVVGLRCEGLVTGWVELSELGDGPCGDYGRPFDDALVVLDSAPLAEVVLGLREHSRLFVSVFGRVGGIVTRSDLQKSPVRMWLFGMVTLIEMRFSRLIEQHCPDGQWKPFLSEGRLKKAEALLAERMRRNQDLDLLDCIQFADKGQVVARNETLRGMTRFTSRRQLEQATKRLEALRNNLAHAQDIVTSDWDTIVMMVENLENILLGPPGLERKFT